MIALGLAATLLLGAAWPPVAAVTQAGAPRRVVVLGIDGMDPKILKQTIELYPDLMPNFRAMVAEHGLGSLGTSTPPQSPVAWSNFITGQDPGGHGIFDFLHRDPKTRMPLASTSVDSAPHSIGLPGSWQLTLGGSSRSNRSGTSFWTILKEHGIPADVWRMPANYPPEPSLGWSFSGMMTPAMDSAYGECTLYTTSPPTSANSVSGRVVLVREFDGRIDAALSGPPNLFRDGLPSASIPIKFHLDREARATAIEVSGRTLILQPGEWSDFVRVTFSFLPLGLSDASGEVRFFLRNMDTEFELYASPVNIDPMDPAAPISAPGSASKQVADERTGIGLYYTQGMPEDVNALKRDLISDAEFVQQSNLVHDEGVRMLDLALDRFLDEQRGGLLFFYFSGVDLCSHMLWRHHDQAHPHHDAAKAATENAVFTGRPGSRWKDIVYEQYLRMDPVLGEVRRRIGSDAVLIVMSDHGFAPYARKFNLNTWLWQQGYLVLDPGLDPAKEKVSLGRGVDWSKTRAYGVGFNGLYLNLAGRELDDSKTDRNEAGIVTPQEAEVLLTQMKSQLESLRDPERGNARVVVRALRAKEVYHGERVAQAPDLIVGYDSGYGNSDEASLGEIGPQLLLDNDQGGTFNGSHLMDAQVVPGGRLLLVDDKGMVLVASPASEGAFKAGVSVAGTDLWTFAAESRTAATRDVVMPDGRRYVWARADTTALANAGVRVLVGTPADAFVGAAVQRFQRISVLYAALSLALFLGVWLMAERSIRRPIAHMTDMASRLAGGDLSARIEPPLPQGELGSLAVAFNQAAGSLQAQRADIERLNARLMQSQRLEAVGS